MTTSGNFEDVPRQSDMVEVCYSNEFNHLDEEVSSTTSDDFIVVSKVFDLNTPLDEDAIRRRLQSYNSTNNGVVSIETHGNDKIIPSAFSMQVEQLKLEQQQQHESDDSSSGDDEDEEGDDNEDDNNEDDDNEDTKEDEESSSERYYISFVYIPIQSTFCCCYFDKGIKSLLQAFFDIFSYQLNFSIIFSRSFVKVPRNDLSVNQQPIDSIPVTPVIEPLIISITEIQPQSDSSSGRFTGVWSSPPVTVGLVDRQPLGSPTSPVPPPTTAEVVVDRQPEPSSRAISDGPDENVTFPPSSQLSVTEPVAISCTTENMETEHPEDDVVVEDVEVVKETELIEEKVISVQPPATLHDEIQKLQMSVGKSLSATEEAVGNEDESKPPKTLLEQAEAAFGDLDVSRSHIDNDVIFGAEGESLTTPTTTGSELPSSQQQQHQITYDGCDDDEDSVIQRIRNQDKKIVEQIRKENEHHPDWLKGVFLF